MQTYYYHIAPATRSYRGKENLTYHFDAPLSKGQVVKITLRSKPSLGVVLSATRKPPFSTSNVDNVVEGVVLPPQNVELLKWMAQYYPGAPGKLAQYFTPSLLPSLDITNPQISSPLKSAFVVKSMPELTEEQKKVLDEIKKRSRSSTFLLHGETGSGKTRVYIELASRCLADGKSALILTPEISLTAPLVKQFEEIFDKKNVICLHSNLTLRQRRLVWGRLLGTEEPLVVIGPRSALFVPIHSLGLIVVDESHDQAYKEESAPYYYAPRVASKLAKISHCKLVFGSGTPLVNEYYLALQKKVPILRMSRLARPLTHKPAKAKIVDMTDDSELGKGIFSKSLLKEIRAAVEPGQQALLFLNRRGSARTILCRSCGWRSLCPNCDNGLVYHQDFHKQQCHTCGHRSVPPSSCPECQSVEIVFKSPGTKSVADELAKLFPHKTIARFDKDSSSAERIEKKYDDILSGKIDILVGTQILTKGHDLPQLTLAAMLATDSSLDFPDYTSEERSYQLINQLKGRINRGHLPGRLLLQTHHPESPTIKQAIKGDWQSFFDRQLKWRKQLGFPPFVHALKIETSKTSRATAESAIHKVVDAYSPDSSLKLIGPAPSYVEKKAGKYHWQLIITSKSRPTLARVANDLSSSYKAELDPLHFL